MRADFQVAEQIHDEKKSRHDKLVNRLASDRNFMQKDCDHGREEWVLAERNFHHLSSIVEIARINLEKALAEEEWQNGNEKMLPDFKCLRDLYDHKLRQQEQLTKQLRIEKRVLREDEDENINQVSACDFTFNFIRFYIHITFISYILPLHCFV